MGRDEVGHIHGGNVLQVGHIYRAHFESAVLPFLGGTLDRITRRAGIKRLCIGMGKNGTVRYPREEVMAYEQERLISTH